MGSIHLAPSQRCILSSHANSKVSITVVERDWFKRLCKLVTLPSRNRFWPSTKNARSEAGIDKK